MIKEVEQYITNNYYELLAISKKYTKNDDWSYELLHCVIEQLYNKKEWKIKLDDNSIKYYIIRCLMVNWTYESSPFFKKHKQDKRFVELNESIEMIVDVTSDFDTEEFLCILEQEFSELSWFNKIMFEKYMLLGSLKKVSKDTTISLASCSRYIKESKKEVKFNTIKKYNK
jgi:hypothetical protein